MSASASTASLFPLITYPQIKQYHEVTDSFARRRPSILRVLSNFRTLSIATGVVPLSAKFRSGKNVRPIAPHVRPLREIYVAPPEYHGREHFRAPGVPCSCPPPQSRQQQTQCPLVHRDHAASPGSALLSWPAAIPPGSSPAG